MSVAVYPNIIVPDYASKPITKLMHPVVAAISLVNKGANNKRFFLFKSEEGLEDSFYVDADGNFAATSSYIDKIMPLIKAGPQDDEWKTVYCVVAVPGEVDSQKDVWTEDGIEEAAHNYLKKSRLINFMHKDFESVGDLVQSAIAPADMHIGDEVITKGSWFIAIEPHPEVKGMIKNGEVTGVSVQGSSKREPVEKHLEKGQYDRSVVTREPAQVSEAEIPKNKDNMEIPMGAEGPGIKALQHILGIPETGEYDETTQEAVIQWMETKGVPGKPTLATVKLILKEGAEKDEVVEEVVDEDVQEAEVETNPEELEEESPEFAKAKQELLAKGTVYHFKGDSSKTPLWISDLGEDRVTVEIAGELEKDAETAEVYLKELYKCDNPEAHYKKLLAKFRPDMPHSAGGNYNPAEENTDYSIDMGNIQYGSTPANEGTDPQDVNYASSDEELKTVILRAMSEGNEFLITHMQQAYNIRSAQDLYAHQFSKDELWGIVSAFVLGRDEKKTSESAFLQPVKRTGGYMYPNGAGQSVQKSADELEKTAMFDVSTPKSFLKDKDGREVGAGMTVSLSGGKEAEVSSVNVETGELNVEVLPKDGSNKIKTVKANTVSVTFVPGAEEVAKGDGLGGIGSVGGHDPRANGKLRFIIRSFGKWAKGKHSVCVRVMRTKHPEVFHGNEDAGCAYLKDQWKGHTKWRNDDERKLGKMIDGNSAFAVHYNGQLAKADVDFDVDALFEKCCDELGVTKDEVEPYLETEEFNTMLDEWFGENEGEFDEADPELTSQVSDILQDSVDLQDKLGKIQALIASVSQSETSETSEVEKTQNNKDFFAAMNALQLGIADAANEEDLEKRTHSSDLVLQDFSTWLNKFVTSGFYVDLNDGEPEEAVTKTSTRLNKRNPKGDQVAETLEKEGNLKGATVQDSNGQKWLVTGQNGNTLNCRSGRRTQQFEVGNVKVVKQRIAKSEADAPVEKNEGAPLMRPKKRLGVVAAPEAEAEAPAPEQPSPVDDEKPSVYERAQRNPRLVPKKVPGAAVEAEKAEGVPHDKKGTDPVPMKPEAPAEAPEEGDKPKSKLSELLARLKNKKVEKSEETDSEETEVDESLEKSADTLTAARIERIRETKQFLQDILNYDDPEAAGDGGEEEVVAEGGPEDTTPEVEAEVETEVAAEEEAPEVEAEVEAPVEAEAEAPGVEQNEVEKDIDASTTETTEVTMSESEITMDDVVEAVNGLGEEVDGIVSRLEQFDTLGSKLDRVGELAKSLDVTERIDAIEKAIADLSDKFAGTTNATESVEEEINKRLNALETQSIGSTAAPVDEVQVIEKSASPQPVLFQREWGSIF